MSVSTVVQIVEYSLGKEKGDQYGHPFLVQTPKTLCEYRQLISKVPNYSLAFCNTNWTFFVTTLLSCCPWIHQQQSRQSYPFASWPS
jgi:hypothetical protein